MEIKKQVLSAVESHRYFNRHELIERKILVNMARALITAAFEEKLMDKPYAKTLFRQVLQSIYKK